jgi:3-(3-hydroxy-phenyl)propionate hydroxylase
MTVQYHSYFNYVPQRAALPPLHAGKETKRHAVIIIGAGPIGLALAMGLARHGVKSLVLENDAHVCVGSRATCISRRSMEILDKLQAAPRIAAKALPWVYGTSFYKEKAVYRLAMPMDENQLFYPMYNLQQNYLEQYLFDEVQARYADSVEVRWQSKVTALDTRPDGASVTVETPDGRYTVEADWLVACDGARSIARQTLGLKFSGTQYEGTYIIVDIHLKSDYPTERRAWFNPPSNPGSTILMHKQPDDIWRVDYQLRDDEDATEAVKPENVLPRVKSHLEWIGEKGDWQPVWCSSYRANCLTLERYHHGRVLFAGDAAHLVPIFGVRGLNSGVDDTHNLAWKLAYVVNGKAAPTLLETYSDERVFAARQNIAAGSKSTEFMAPPSAAFKLMRQAALSLGVQDPCFATLVNPRQTSAITYAESRINRPSSGSVPWKIPLGAALQEVPLDMPMDRVSLAGTFLTQELGLGFTAITFGGKVPRENLPHATLLHINAVDATVSAESPLRDRPDAQNAFGRAHALYGVDRAGATLLVRPDGHVMARYDAFNAAQIAADIQAALQ